MRLLFHQLVIGCRIVALYVLWTSIILSPQPSDGVRKEGWDTLFDLYGSNLELIEQNLGDVLVKELGGHMLIYDTTDYFQIFLPEPEKDQREIQFRLYPYPKDRWAGYPGYVKKIAPSRRPDITLALAKRLVGRYFPFQPDRCNKDHWWNYITKGKLRINYHNFKRCPLTAPLDGVSADDIKYGVFKLKDSNGIEHDLSEYNTSKEYLRNESIREGIASTSQHQGASSNTWIHTRAVLRACRREKSGSIPSGRPEKKPRSGPSQSQGE